MNLRFLETFIWVAKLGSFRAAANQLHLTQAAISRRIASLESELGQLLFERSNRNIQLTSAGYHLLRFSNQVLNLERDLLADFQGKLALRGRVRLGIVESIVHTWFNSFISELHRTHPDIELELTVEPSRRLSDLLMQGLLDVALQTDPILAEGIRNVPVGGLKMGLVIAAGIDPIWFGVYLILTVEMAQITPPIGFNLFVLQNITERNLFELIRYAFPFFLLLVLATALVTIFPEIVLYLPEAMR